MKLFIINTSTIDTVSYLSGTIVVGPGATVEVPLNQLRFLVVDTDFIRDNEMNNIFLSNGSRIFDTVIDSSEYLVTLLTTFEQIMGDGARSGGLYGNVSLPTANVPVEVKIGATKLNGRRTVVICAIDSDIYWGFDNLVSSSNGMPVPKGTTFSVELGGGLIAVWVVATTSSKNIRVIESL